MAAQGPKWQLAKVIGGIVVTRRKCRSKRIERYEEVRRRNGSQGLACVAASPAGCSVQRERGVFICMDSVLYSTVHYSVQVQECRLPSPSRLPLHVLSPLLCRDEGDSLFTAAESRRLDMYIYIYTLLLCLWVATCITSTSLITAIAFVSAARTGLD